MNSHFDAVGRLACVVMTLRRQGIQYAEAPRSIMIASEYWIARFRGR
jgi:hypothetical protein